MSVSWECCSILANAEYLKLDKCHQSRFGKTDLLKQCCFCKNRSTGQLNLNLYDLHFLINRKVCLETGVTGENDYWLLKSPLLHPFSLSQYFFLYIYIYIYMGGGICTFLQKYSALSGKKIIKHIRLNNNSFFLFLVQMYPNLLIFSRSFQFCLLSGWIRPSRSIQRQNVPGIKAVGKKLHFTFL